MALRLCLLVCLPFITGVQAGKILVVPVDGSHWLNLKIFMIELAQKGHELIVTRPSVSWYIDETSEHFKVLDIPMAGKQQFSREQYEDHVQKWIFQRSFAKHSSPFTTAWESIKTLNTGIRLITVVLEAMFENAKVMDYLKNANFDLVLADPYNVGGIMLAYHLKLPVVFFGRWMPSDDVHFVIAPSPLSYVPVVTSRLTDRMVFSERVKNVLVHLYRSALYFLIYPTYDKLAQRYLNTDVSVYEMYKHADMYLMKVDFVLEFPRPTLPNAVYIGGFQCKPSKPLPQDMQQFMDSSVEGVVVFSLGTLVKSLPLHIAREVAAGLAQLKERVIWRYSGEPLDTLGNNTVTVNWLPQNDLLSHGNTKVFFAHGGENGIYEAIYHGVPIVGFPLFGDQFENLLRLKMRGAAVVLENTQVLTAKDVFDAVRLVIDNPSYRQAMMRLSKLYKDTPVPPMNLAVFWTEFVMRHKGAGHLKAAGNDLVWYQYYLLDVMCGFLIACIIFLYTTCKFFRAVLKICCGRKKEKQKRS
ncbi:UDP-glucuronosyltransferase 2A2-like [Hyperolius riggenbachi]|uniref:UDP-glucuronosyltransferase 2A2-like n=1 Tax=Hyperolius riggenbachi TaxID=752182 RepID=UPI0035A30FF3